MKKVVASILAVALVLSLTGCAARSRVVTTDKLQVIATLFPQYDFIRAIAGDKVEVSLLLPPGVEPHAYEPSPRDIVDIQKAAMFVYTGKYMEPWAEKIIEASKGKSLLIVDASHGIALMDEDDHHHHDDDHHDDDHHDDDHDDDRDDDHDDHGHGGKDPHIWLDPIYAQKMVDNIVDGLVQIDPSNASYYRENGEAYKAKLQNLDQKYVETLSQVETRTILYAGHFAFGYLAKRYDLEHMSPYTGFAPNAEPTPHRIVELIKNIEASKSKVIYYEELVDPKIARVIAEQTGAKMVLLHGAHNMSKDELSSGVSYLTIMEENLQKLREGLGGE